MKLVNFNVNDHVHVKLTREGIKELRKQHKELRETFPKLHEFNIPRTDEEGYTRYQLWELMRTFGHIMFNGSNVPFETEIKFEVES